MPQTPPVEAVETLEISEAVSLLRPTRGESPSGRSLEPAAEGSPFLKPLREGAEPKEVLVHVIRPGVGKGKGRHLYEAKMLQANAGVFAGWKQFVDHRSPEARKVAGGLPRGVRELGGRILESWWDPTVPADPDKGHGQGAVVGISRPVKFLREMIDDDPELVETSISAKATAVKPVEHGGARAWAVEGIAPKGSLDWVTEAGAGGRVAPLLEAAYATDDDVELALMESLTDEELLAHLQDDRPSLLEAVKEGSGSSAPPDDKAEEQIKKLLTTGKAKTRAQAEALVKQISESAEEDDDMPITPESLREAITSDPEGFRTILREALGEPEGAVNLQEALASDEGRGLVRTMLEEQIGQERELMRAEARADAQREVQLARLEVEAHRQIDEARWLPPTWRDSVKELFSLDESTGQPSTGLDVIDDVDDQGATTKSAREKLREAVEAECEKQRKLLAEAAPTRVTGQGSSGNRQPGEPGASAAAKPADSEWGQFLQEHGIDPETAYLADPRKKQPASETEPAKAE